MSSTQPLERFERAALQRRELDTMVNEHEFDEAPTGVTLQRVEVERAAKAATRRRPATHG